MAIVDTVELITCMCGRLERRCPHCGKAFEIPVHREDAPLLQATGGIAYCVHCGMPTTDEHSIRGRSREDVLAERKG